MTSNRRFTWLYVAGGAIFLLGLYLVRTSEWRAKQTPDIPKGRTILSQFPRPWQSEIDSNLSNNVLNPPGAISNSRTNSQPSSDPSDSSPADNGRNQPSAAPYTKSYMLTLRIPEQLTMSSIHFHQLLNVANDWGCIGVEPFVYSTRSRFTMFGLRNSRADDLEGFLPYNKLFNSTLQNKFFGECMKRQPHPKTGIPIVFEPMVDFLRSSYRKLILVIWARGSSSKVDKQVNGQKGAFVDCSSGAEAQGMFVDIEKQLSKEIEIERLHPSLDNSPPLPEHLEEFKVVQAFCIKTGVRISLRDFKTFVFDHIGAHKSVEGANEFSVLFISWQGRFTHPLVDTDVSNYINLCRIPFGTPYYSDYVINAAKRYIDSLNFHGKPFLSIHIRFEKLFRMARKNRLQFVDCCMKRLNSAISAAMAKFNISKGNAVLNWDYSPLGSVACPIGHCREIADENLKKLNVKPTFVDPKKFGLPVNGGLIALIEMNVLYSGKVLLTVGEGSYQATIIDSFITAHQEKFMSEEGITNATIALNKAKELVYGHPCGPGNIPEFVDDLDIEPKCTP